MAKLRAPEIELAPRRAAKTAKLCQLARTKSSGLGNFAVCAHISWHLGEDW